MKSSHPWPNGLAFQGHACPALPPRHSRCPVRGEVATRPAPAAASPSPGLSCPSPAKTSARPGAREKCGGEQRRASGERGGAALGGCGGGGPTPGQREKQGAPEDTERGADGPPAPLLPRRPSSPHRRDREEGSATWGGNKGSWDEGRCSKLSLRKGEERCFWLLIFLSTRVGN